MFSSGRRRVVVQPVGQVGGFKLVEESYFDVSQRRDSAQTSAFGSQRQHHLSTQLPQKLSQFGIGSTHRQSVARE